jgi:hypothetical protein
MHVGRTPPRGCPCKMVRRAELPRPLTPIERMCIKRRSIPVRFYTSETHHAPKQALPWLCHTAALALNSQLRWQNPAGLGVDPDLSPSIVRCSASNRIWLAGIVPYSPSQASHNLQRQSLGPLPTVIYHGQETLVRLAEPG